MSRTNDARAVSTPSGRRAILRMATASVAMGLGARASAQEAFPSRPVRIVVPYAAGGPLDSVTRMMGERLSKNLGQPVTIDNRTGASGIIGVDAVAKSAPDGYTLLSTVSDTQINNTVLFKQLPYDPIADFTPIVRLGDAAIVLVVHRDSPFRSVADIVAAAKRSPGKVTFGSIGAGSLNHVIFDQLARVSQVELTHVPYRGEVLAVQDVIGRQVDMALGSLLGTRQFIESGMLRPLSLSGETRLAALPDVRTFAELGYSQPIFRRRQWVGIFAPSKTPAAIVQRLNADCRAALSRPDAVEFLVQRGFEPAASSQEAFRDHFMSDFDTTTRLIKTMNLPLQ